MAKWRRAAKSLTWVRRELETETGFGRCITFFRGSHAGQAYYHVVRAGMKTGGYRATVAEAKQHAELLLA